MPQEGEKNDDRNGNSQQVKQNSTTHDFLLCSGLAYPSVRLALKSRTFPPCVAAKTGGKGADKQSGGEPQRQLGRCLSSVVQISLCPVDDVRNPLVGINLTKPRAGHDDLRHIGAIRPSNIAVTKALRQYTRNFAASSSQIGRIWVRRRIGSQ